MKKIIFTCLLTLSLNVFATVNLPAGGSAVVNGVNVTCAGSGASPMGAIVCACNSNDGVVGSVFVSGGLSAVDECEKLSAGTKPSQCTPITSTTGYYKCDCNSIYGSVGQVTIVSGTSAVAECNKLSSGTKPSNCSGL